MFFHFTRHFRAEAEDFCGSETGYRVDTGLSGAGGLHLTLTARTRQVGSAGMFSLLVRLVAFWPWLLSGPRLVCIAQIC